MENVVIVLHSNTNNCRNFIARVDLLISPVAIAVGGSHFGGGAGSIWLQGVACSGSEGQLIDCLTPAQKTTQWTEVNCGSHLRDAGVLCIGMTC